MRRTVVVVGVAFAIVGGFTPQVVAAPKASVTDSVERGSQITIIATDCKPPGSDFTAEVWIEIVHAASPFYDTYEYATDADGTTEIKITMAVVGTSWVRVECIHLPSDGERSTWYDETEEVDVIEKSGTLTKAEKKKCKKKKTSEKRRKCRQRQAAD